MISSQYFPSQVILQMGKFEILDFFFFLKYSISFSKDEARTKFSTCIEMNRQDHKGLLL